jgi:hypothetical protein
MSVNKKISNVLSNGEWIIFMDISPLEWLPRRIILIERFFISEFWKKIETKKNFLRSLLDVEF